MKKVIGRRRESGGLHLLDDEMPFIFSRTSISPLQIHCRLGHPSCSSLKTCLARSPCLSYIMSHINMPSIIVVADKQCKKKRRFSNIIWHGTLFLYLQVNVPLDASGCFLLSSILMDLIPVESLINSKGICTGLWCWLLYYSNTISPVANFAFIRLFVSLAATHQWPLIGCEECLHGALQEEV